MASKTICTSCLRAQHLQARRHAIVASSRTRNILYEAREAPNFMIASRQFSTTRRQYETPKKPPPPPRIPKNQHDAITSFAASVRQSETFKSTTEPYIAYGSTEDLFRECSRQCNYTVPSRIATPPSDPPRTEAGEDLGEGEGWWYLPKAAGGLGLDVTFNTWAQIMFLHMYMLTVRLRCFPAKHARIWHQNLLDHFFYAAEDRMVQWHAINMRGSRNKYLKDLWQQWRGVILSYDEGLVRGDAVLATAIWRNIFKASDDADISDLALVTAYLRGQLKMLDDLSDERIASGDVQFGDPASVRQLVEQASQSMRQRIGEDELKTLQQESEAQKN